MHLGKAGYAILLLGMHQTHGFLKVLRSPAAEEQESFGGPGAAWDLLPYGIATQDMG